MPLDFYSVFSCALGSCLSDNHAGNYHLYMGFGLCTAVHVVSVWHVNACFNISFTEPSAEHTIASASNMLLSSFLTIISCMKF